MESINLVIAVIAFCLSVVTAYWQFFRKPKLHILYEDIEPYRKYLIDEEKKQNLQAEWYIRIRLRIQDALLLINVLVKFLNGTLMAKSYFYLIR